MATFGGNSGYIGYSQSKRSLSAKNEGRYPKTLFKKYYSISEKKFKELEDRGVIYISEWHHTSKFGNKTNFYSIDDAGAVTTSRTMYADFFIQEKFKRISTPDDKILLLVDTNNVVDFFNHKTNIVSFLESNINEWGADFEAVRETIAKECNSIIMQSYTLIPPSELLYYSDTKTSFGLPFKNGFFYFDANDREIKSKAYTDVKGFFSPHKIQSREFKYTDEVGMFEQFLNRVAIGREEANSTDTRNTNSEFQKMFGYLCHTYKSQTTSPSIIFTDLDANDENRNGGRGKSMVWDAIQLVTKTMIKGGIEFDPNYTFCFSDLDKSYNLYVVDDVPCNFNFNSLYTQITGGINAQLKGINFSICFPVKSLFIINSLKSE